MKIFWCSFLVTLHLQLRSIYIYRYIQINSSIWFFSVTHNQTQQTHHWDRLDAALLHEFSVSVSVFVSASNSCTGVSLWFTAVYWFFFFLLIFFALFLGFFLSLILSPSLSSSFFLSLLTSISLSLSSVPTQNIIHPTTVTIIIQVQLWLCCGWFGSI